ncbi:GrpB family protein [Rhizobium lusitanum]|uniref:GrpB family protein n=1 Tax=Rhizobium lusitanum TaxID=293958 RepID=UPI0016136342|nr:GrpB family protein [Rhizobium lusitanum]QND50080.1 GrpB family protein [Rhizobium lusitanum]
MSSESDDSFGLGVGNKCVTLAESNARWLEAYRLEEAGIRGALGDLALDIQHIGSTSIPSIKAKPIIDIAVGVRRFDDGLACIQPMEAIGYDYAGTDIVPDDHIFGRGVKGETRTHLVHIVEYNGINWNRWLLFRGRLRANPDLALAYEMLKIDLAGKYADNRAAYTQAKRAFIDKVLAADDPI